MKITVAHLKQLIREVTKSHIEDESSLPPGSWNLTSEPMSPEEASHLDGGVWAGGYANEDEEDLEEEKEVAISHDMMQEIVSEGIMLAQLGVLDQFELDIEEIKESVLEEAKYKGREVKLGKPMRGDRKKYKVYVKDPKTGNIKKVEFGDPNMEIRRDNPKARKSFRARHGCGTPRASDRTKAAYWSCRMWSAKPVSKILKGK